LAIQPDERLPEQPETPAPLARRDYPEIAKQSKCFSTLIIQCNVVSYQMESRTVQQRLDRSLFGSFSSENPRKTQGLLKNKNQKHVHFSKSFK
jgi:hypothetical protein